jgi:hypothetical protein
MAVDDMIYCRIICILLNLKLVLNNNFNLPSVLHLLFLLFEEDSGDQFYRQVTLVTYGKIEASCSGQGPVL